MKRKYLSLGLALVMALTLCACGGGAVNGTSTGKEDGKLASGRKRATPTCSVTAPRT